MYKKKHSNRICTYPGCGRMYYAKGLCFTHYQMVHVRGTQLRAVYSEENRKRKSCKHPGCERMSVNAGYCNMHFERFRKWGDSSISKIRGRKSQGGHQDYPNHSLLKRNRLIKLEMNPICEHCGIEPSKMTHHIDLKKTDHSIDNLMALCSGKCHKFYHLAKDNRKERHLRDGFIIQDEFSKKEVEEMFRRDQNIKFDFSKEKIYNKVCRKANTVSTSISPAVAKAAVRTTGNM